MTINKQRRKVIKSVAAGAAARLLAHNCLLFERGSERRSFTRAPNHRFQLQERVLKSLRFLRQVDVSTHLISLSKFPEDLIGILRAASL